MRTQPFRRQTVAYELVAILRMAIASGKALGIDVTIFNPKLDEDGAIARRFVKALCNGLVARDGEAPGRDPRG